VGTPIVAYGAAVRTGYANADTACSTAAGGTQLKGGAGNPIQLMDSEDAYYLAKHPGNAIGTIYTNGDATAPEANSWANGQTIYLTAQALSPAIGGRNSVAAGYYTLTAVNIADEGDPIYVYRVDETTLADTTGCAWPNPQSGPDGPRYSSKFVDNDMSELVTQYDRAEGLESFVPIKMSVRGPSNLRSRPHSKVYKVTKE